MSANDDEFGGLKFLLFLLWTAGWMWVAMNIVAEHWRKDAVKRDKAEFYFDKDNERQWRWKP